MIVSFGCQTTVKGLFDIGGIFQKGNARASIKAFDRTINDTQIACCVGNPTIDVLIVVSAIAIIDIRYDQGSVVFHDMRSSHTETRNPHSYTVLDSRDCIQ
jgi:hypothetical protein